MSGTRKADLFDPAPLLAVFGDAKAADVGAALGVTTSTVKAWRCGKRRLYRHRADELAVRVGEHPGALWPDWWSS